MADTHGTRQMDGAEMSTSRALKQLKSVWGKAGLDRIPSPDETKGNMQQPETATATCWDRAIGTIWRFGRLC